MSKCVKHETSLKEVAQPTDEMMSWYLFSMRRMDMSLSLSLISLYNKKKTPIDEIWKKEFNKLKKKHIDRSKFVDDDDDVARGISTHSIWDFFEHFYDLFLFILSQHFATFEKSTFITTGTWIYLFIT